MKTVVVTGANRGLGAALLAQFRAQGWHVVATARKIEALEAGENITRLALDLSDYDSVRAMAEAVSATGRVVDMIVNNAGFNPKDSGDRAYFASTFEIAKFSGQNVADSLHINALAPMELVSKLLPCLADDAVILNMSSWLGSIETKSSGGHYGYAGSKALLNMFTRALALEFTESPRSAVAFNPGWMRTDMGGAKADRTPDEVARAILELYETGALHKSNGRFINTDGSRLAW